MRACIVAVAAGLCAASLFAVRTPAGFAEGAGTGRAPSQRVHTRYTVRLEALELLRHRLLVDAPGFRLLLAGELDGSELGGSEQDGSDAGGSEPVAIRLGVSLPFGVAGPVALEGLWRKISNPLAHGPGSPAHEEPTGLRLDASLDGSSRSGLALQLAGFCGRRRSASWPQEGLAGGLALLDSSGSGLQGGGWLELRRAGAALTALASCSAPPRDDGGESWYLDEVPYPGGGLAHLAAGFRGCSESASLFWAGALSGGPLTCSGVFSDLVVRVCGPAGRVDLLGGVCSRGYRAPDGDAAHRSLHAAAAAELESASFGKRGRLPTGAVQGTRGCRLRMEVGAAAGSRPAGALAAERRPAGSGSPGIPSGAGPPAEGERWISADGRWERRLAEKRTLRLLVRGARQLHWSAPEGGAGTDPAADGGGLCETVEAEVGAELSSPSPGGSVEAALGVRTDDGEERYTLELVGRREGERRSGSLLLRAAVRRPHGPEPSSSPACLELMARGGLAWEESSLFLQVAASDLPVSPRAGAGGASSGPVPPPAVTLGFEVRAAGPAWAAGPRAPPR